VVFLLINLGAVGNGGRKRAKRAVCLANLRQLTLAWTQYANYNDDMIVNGDAGHNHVDQKAWVGRCWYSQYHQGAQLPKEDQEKAIKEGALWPYCKEIKLYRCPSGYPGEMLTYAIVDSMNGYPQPGSPRGRGPVDVIDRLLIKNRMQIHSPKDRIVFLDQGWVTPDSYAVFQNRMEWWEDPVARHGDGMPVSLADGHAKYWKWKGAETIEYARKCVQTRPPGRLVPATPEGREDLYKVQKAVWWEVGYTPTF